MYSLYISLKSRLAVRLLWVALAVAAFAGCLMAQQGAGPSRAQLLSAQSASGPGFAAITQSSQQMGSSMPSLMNQVQVQGPFRGSIPRTGVNGQQTLTFDSALELAFRYNLGSTAASLAADQARGGLLAARSALLPTVTGSVSESVEKVNLAAEGFDASSLGSVGQYFPSTVGPFHFYTAQAQLSDNAFDLVAWRNFGAAREMAQAARLSSLDAREQLTLAVAGTYLQVMAASSLAEADRAAVKYGKTAYEQAKARGESGASAQIEVNRSLVEYHVAEQRLLGQEAEVRKLKMTLSRMIGLPIDAEFELLETLLEQSIGGLPIEEAYHRSENRRDLAAARAQLRAAEQAAKAANAERLPTLGVSGSFGVQGIDPNKGTDIYSGTASLSFPIFTGKRIQGDREQAQAALKMRQAELANATEEARMEVRIAWIDFDVALKQVELAEANQSLARETLTQSIDRFSAGAADSVEVVQSEESLASAEHDFVSSKFSAALARVSLARAMGEAEKEVPAILKGSKE
jgi:outer membrane protein TolC